MKDIRDNFKTTASRNLISALVTSVVMLVSVASAQPLFTSTMTLPGGNIKGEAVAFGDFDGDFIADDIVVVTQGNEKDYVYLHNGGTSWTRVALEENTTAWDVAVGDLNNDGRDDIYVATSNARDIRYMGTATAGVFTKHWVGTVNTDSRGVAIGDLDGNFYLDVAVATGGLENHLMHKNIGNHVPVTVQLNPGTVDLRNGRDIEIADVDGDGFMDLFVVTATGKDFVYVNNGSASFTKEDMATTTGNAVVWGDFDQGALGEDLFVAASGSTDYFAHTKLIPPPFPWFDPTIAWNEFGLNVNAPAGTVRVSAAAGDFDGDFKDDVAVVLENGTDYLYINNSGAPGAISFSVGEGLSGTAATRGVTAMDVDDDGDLDLVFAAVDAAPFVYVNELIDNAPEDLDGDGVYGIDDIDDNDAFVCTDDDGDGCDDCAVEGFWNPYNDGPDFDADGLCDSGDLDDDDDSVLDVVDFDPYDMFVCADTDNDGCDDCSEGYGLPLTFDDGPDYDSDGECNYGDEDDDNDGIPDAWEEEFGLDPLNEFDADDDDDLDGVSNIDEFTAGSNPQDDQDYGQVLTSLVENGQWKLRFTAEKADGAFYVGRDRMFTVQECIGSATEEQDWEDLSGYEDILGNDQLVTVTVNTTSGTPRLYRLHISLQP